MSPDHEIAATGGSEPGIYIECRAANHGIAVARPWADGVKFCPACGVRLGPRALARSNLDNEPQTGSQRRDA